MIKVPQKQPANTQGVVPLLTIQSNCTMSHPGPSGLFSPAQRASLNSLSFFLAKKSPLSVQLIISERFGQLGSLRILTNQVPETSNHPESLTRKVAACELHHRFSNRGVGQNLCRDLHDWAEQILKMVKGAWSSAFSLRGTGLDKRRLGL
jgi:hypothetical protein